MDWKTVKLLTLHKMFMLAGNDIVKDETTNEYLEKMWGPANEAMIRLATVGKTIMKEGIVDLEDDKVIKTSNRTYINLNDFCENLFNVDITTFTLDEERYSRFDIVGEQIVMEPERTGTLKFLYNAFPILFSPATSDEQVIPLSDDCCVLLPLYIASQLYKDDDNSLATIYRNEFETGLESIQARTQTRKVRFVNHGYTI